MKKLLLLFFPTLLFFAACDNGSGKENPCETDFDQKAMFLNMANNIILPAYADLKTKTDALAIATTAFEANPTLSNLTALRTDWWAAYLSWQTAAPFNFGPAETVFLRNSVNNFPLDTAAVLENISAGGYTLESPDAYDKGFPALDYLLYGIGATDAAILEKYTTNAAAAQFLKYLTDVVTDIETRVNSTYNGWQNDGYDETFANNTGTAAGTSLGLIINNLNENYELIKREKIGIPSGILTLGFTNPTKVEAYYSGRSLELAVAGLAATEQWYLGNQYTGETGLGLDDYLQSVAATKSDGSSLDDAIKSQFTVIQTNLTGLSGKLSDLVETNTAGVETAYNSLSAQLVNIKTDLPSVLCVSITYIDNPSDSD